MATPRKTVEALEKSAIKMSPDEFRAIFESTLSATADIDLQSRLFFLAGMYLDQHPGAFLLSRQLAEKFLEDEDYNRLLAGLKGIYHSSATENEVVRWFLVVMKRDDWDAKCAGLYRLDILLNDRGPPVVEQIDAETMLSLRQTLVQIQQDADDEWDRNVAARCLANLKH
jgi:hypothetical protein